jgi:NADH-quinone oxidoreductase subunit G
VDAFATLDSLRESTGVVVIGTRIATDNPGVRYAMTTAARHHGAKISYMHPMEDTLLQNTVTQFVKYEVGTEEGVLALLAKALLTDSELTKKARSFLEGLDEGYLSAESNVGEEELERIRQQLVRSRSNTLVLGSDLMTHPRAENIARIAATIARFSDFRVLFVPREVNTVGVAAICDLDAETESAFTVGYNAEGDFVIGADGNADLVTPALNQQEGTVVSLDNHLLPLNAALGFEGYELNELANAFGVGKEETVDFTQELPAEAGFDGTPFDALENFYSPLGEDRRGYRLRRNRTKVSAEPETVEELPEFNGTVVYRCDPVLQFNTFTARTKQLGGESRALLGSEQFATAARIADGDRIVIARDGRETERVFKLDTTLKGTIALEPTFDTGFTGAGAAYRFEKVKIMKASNDE